MDLSPQRRETMIDGVPFLDGAAPELGLEPAELGAFVHVRRDRVTARFAVQIGRPLGVRRYVVCHRVEPFWMKPFTGTRIGAIPSDTQVAWFELDSGKIALVVPLVLAPFRASLEGRGDELWAVIDSGDPHTRGNQALVLYAAVGNDPYELARRGAEIVNARLGTGRLRREKPLPDFVDDFGWCTWDAFYQEVSQEKVREGLESFRRGGVEPRFLILDDGWQSVRETETGERRLVGWDADQTKFPGGLGATVELAKTEYQVKAFLVWHAVHGYWGGIDGEALPNYGVESVLRWYSPEILRHTPTLPWDWWGACVGRPDPDAIGRFYADYHARLALCGVDGVKVDNQSSVEGLSHGVGGRVSAMEKTSRGLEESVEIHFHGRLINCMSCANERLYQTRTSSLVRTSVDFWPNLPASHGLHVYTNALVGLWFGEFIHPDWDMFQSGHPAGAFHAAARAVAGSPVYVSDRPDAHDFEVLRRLVLADGSVLRARDIGLPTRDSLFDNPLEEPVLFKVFNTNHDAGVVGLFNARYRKGDNSIDGSVSPADVPGLAGEEFAVYLGRRERLIAPVARNEAIGITLDTLEWEIATIVPIDYSGAPDAMAPIGLGDKLNAGGAVLEKGWRDGRWLIRLRDGGEFIAYVEHRPARVQVDGHDHDFTYSQGRLSVPIARTGACSVEIWPGARS
jgi:raffinose synthase